MSEELHHVEIYKPKVGSSAEKSPMRTQRVKPRKIDMEPFLLQISLQL